MRAAGRCACVSISTHVRSRLHCDLQTHVHIQIRHLQTQTTDSSSPLFVSSLGCRFPACTSCLGSNARLMFSRSRQIRRLSGRSITSSEGQDIGFGLRVPEVRGGTQATSHAGDFSCTSHGMPGIVSFSCMASAAKALHRERSRPPFSSHELDRSAARWGLTRNLKVIRPQGLSKVQSLRPV